MSEFANNEDALRSAAVSGDVDAVALLLDRGADIHADNDVALRRAASLGHVEVVALLLDRDADIHAEDDEALGFAAGNGHQDTVALLLDRGADIHADNDVALRWAASFGHVEVVGLLLDRGADIRAEDGEALRTAAESGHRETVKLLLASGADRNRINDDGTIASVLSEIKSETANRFTRIPTRAQCFRRDDQCRLSEDVLLSCVTGQFTTLICAPLIASKAQADRQLVLDMWNALPPHWQDEYQNLLMSFVKEGGLKPVLGLHGNAVHGRDSVINR